jgi:hypothetical protein
MTPTCRDVLPVPVDAPVDPLQASFSSTRRRRSAAAAIGHTDRWHRDALCSINALFGSGDATGYCRSASQTIGATHCRDVVAAMGPPPPCTPAAALSKLCGEDPGYMGGQASAPATYRAGAVSLPTAGPRCDPGLILTGEDADLWANWRTKLLRPCPLETGVRPHTDPVLRRSARAYALFLGELYDRNLIVNATRIPPGPGICHG